MQKSTIKYNFRPQKCSENSWKQKKACCLPVMNKKKRKIKRHMRDMVFVQNCGVAVTHHHGDCLKLCQLWPLFICYAPKYIWSANECHPLHVAWHVVISNQKGCFIEWGPFSLSQTWLIESVPCLNCGLRWSVIRGTLSRGHPMSELWLIECIAFSNKWYFIK